MHQMTSELQIGKESCGLSCDSDPTPPIFLPSILQKNLLGQSILHITNHTPTQFQKHIQIQIPSPSSVQCPSSNQSTPSTPTHQNPKQTQFQNLPNCNNRPSNKTLLSTPHKMPVMSQTPSSLYHSPSLHHYHNTTVLDSESSQSPFLCFSSFAVALATKAIALKVSTHFCFVRWRQVRFLQFFILISLPSLYFFTLNSHRAFLLHFLSALAFSAVLVISLNLALPRLPSIRLLLSRSFPIKLSSITTASKPHPPVVWSIGSKSKSKKLANSGSWVQVYSNGDVYEGEFHKGKCSGSGVYYYYMSGRYEGDWVDAKYDGHGVETWAKGSRYRGQYRQGLRHGFGVYRFYTGDVYSGEWSNGQCHGCGVHTCEDGGRYVGEFKWGVKHGLGHYHFRNGDIYAGEYFADKMHGFGVYCFGNGHRYEGAWHEGKKQGFGMYTFRNEDSQSGYWQDGVLNVSSTQDTPDHLKVHNTVQEAQRTAKKAYNVATVDERVNKAVAAANKAANAARVAAVKAVQNRMHHYNSNDNASNPIV
ncbi:hypothetical protein F0562_012566 [Nyssa sinensis]|uniref:Uncharacterized protein n=1 Tax=Nyssa sinensis TaxID=561372 RepID=A0A5J4ZUV0_9ASTE|nr:hypothetical protein F0562_012566 [Nyssa sinensis]